MSQSSMNKTPSQEEIAKTLAHLEISAKVPQKLAHKPKSKPVADSWDDDSSSSDTEDASVSMRDSKSTTSPRDSLDPITTTTSTDLPPQPPPPTPASPTPFDFSGSSQYAFPSGRGDSIGRSGTPEKRPEKTTAVAGRLIAGALGVRAPKRTEEEREYDKAMREKERKRKDSEREQKRKEDEAAEARKKAVWDD